MKLPIPFKLFSLGALFSAVLLYLILSQAVVQCAHNESTITTPSSVVIITNANNLTTSTANHTNDEPDEHYFTSPKPDSELNNKSGENVDESNDDDTLTTTTEPTTSSSIDDNTNGTTTVSNDNDKEVESEGNEGEKNEESEELSPPEEGGEESGDGAGSGGSSGSSRPEVGSEEEEPEDGEPETEERCNFNQFLSGLNISHYLPPDRVALRDEFDSFQDAPERIRHSPSVNYTIQRLKRLLNLANGITSRQELRSGFASFIQHNYELFLELELDAACMTSIISIIAAMRRSELWAIKFIDSMAKPPAGVLSGVTSFLGDFEQCISVRSPETASEEFSGQYCLLRPILPMPDVRRYTGATDENLIGETKILNYLAAYSLDGYAQTNPVLKFIEHMKTHSGRVLNLAICLPDLCSPKQLEKSFNRLLYPIVGIPFEIHNSSCWTEAKTKDLSIHLNRYSQFAIFTLSFIAVTVLMSTFYELYCAHQQRKAMAAAAVAADKNGESKRTNSIQLLLVFSAISNTRRLFYPKTARFAVVDTLRLGIIVLNGLTSAFFNTPLSSGLRRLAQSAPYELLADPKYFFIRAPTLLNDGLLIIAGSLFAQSIFSLLSSDACPDNFSYILYLLRRWFRLSAPLFGSILFLLVLPMTGYGPLWDRLVDVLLPPCQSTSSLTSSLLYYSNWNFLKSNFSNADAYVVCNPDTWFLSILFQLNIVFFMVVVFLYQSPRNGLRLLIFFILASIILNVSPWLFHANAHSFYELTRQPSLWHLRRSFFLYHQNILQYVGAFSVGVVLGYALLVVQSKQKESAARNAKPNHQQQQQLQASYPESSSSQRRREVYNWLAVGTILAVYAWVNTFFQQNASPAEASVLLFFSFGRLAFCLAFAYMVYACVSGKFEILANLLAAPVLQPLARLSFCIFLVQNLVQYHRMYSVKDTYVMTFRGTIENYTIDFVISSVVAYFLFLLFEAPAQRLNELFCLGITGGGSETSGGGGANSYADSNRAYIFEHGGQLHNNKSGSVDHLQHPQNHYNHHHRYLHSTTVGVQQQLQHKSQASAPAQSLTHRSKITTVDYEDEFTDGTIINIRF